jgi:hypothetical protein
VTTGDLATSDGEWTEEGNRRLGAFRRCESLPEPSKEELKEILKEIYTVSEENSQPAELIKAVLTGSGGGESIFGTTEWSAGWSPCFSIDWTGVGFGLGRHTMSLPILVSFGVVGFGRVESFLACVHSVCTRVRF